MSKEYIEHCYKAISEQKDILDILIVDRNGIPVKSTMDTQISLQYVGMFGQLVDKAHNAIITLNPEDDLTFLRVRTKKHETLITSDTKLTFIVIQNPQCFK